MDINREVKRIRNTLIIAILVFAVILSAAVGFIGFQAYSRSVLSGCAEALEDISAIAINGLDGDDIENCIESGEESEGYGRAQRLLDNIKASDSVKDIYIAKPVSGEAEGNMMYVVKGVTDEELSDYPELVRGLGDISKDEFPPEVLSKFKSIMEGRTVEEFFERETALGGVYSLLVPLKNSSGEPVAVLGLDSGVNAVSENRVDFIFYILIVSAVLILIFLIIMLIWLNRRVIDPLLGLKMQSDVARSEAESANKAKTKFLREVSRNVCIPFDAIIGYTAIARRNVGDRQKVTECLDKMQVAENNLLDHINRILEMDNPEAFVSPSVRAFNSAKQETEDNKSVLKGKRILVVEDNEMNREIARDILEDHGATVEEAQDGDIAVERMVGLCMRGQYTYYDAILMDIQMPNMNGYEATRAIRGIPMPESIHIPIIAMTASAFEQDRLDALRAGMDEHLTKPIDPKKLINALR